MTYDRDKAEEAYRDFIQELHEAGRLRDECDDCLQGGHDWP